jgi:hypothetical protein
MKRLPITMLFATLLTLGWMASRESVSSAAQTPGGGKVSGHGKYRFRVLYTSSHLPAQAQAVLKGAHGGFAVDTRPGKGETYFALKGAGIIQISADMKSTRMLSTPAEMKDVNSHNAGLWHAREGGSFLMFPSNDSNQVFTTTIDGKLVSTLKAPEGGRDLGHPVATDYFAGRGNFIPTDVDQLDGMMYVSTGYSNLDFMLTARILSTNPYRVEWHDLAFGGKGAGAGQFGTGHGVTVVPKEKRIDVADRPNSEIDRFTRHGQYLSTLRMPLGSFPCDIYYLGRYAVVGSLHGPDRSKGAPIYLMEDDKLVSTVMAKEDLGLDNFQHIHNAVIREVGGKLYIIAQAWNPGDFAILEQVN